MSCTLHCLCTGRRCRDELYIALFVYREAVYLVLFVYREAVSR